MNPQSPRLDRRTLLGFSTVALVAIALFVCIIGLFVLAFVASQHFGFGIIVPLFGLGAIIGVFSAAARTSTDRVLRYLAIAVLAAIAVFDIWSSARTSPDRIYENVAALCAGLVAGIIGYAFMPKPTRTAGPLTLSQIEAILAEARSPLAATRDISKGTGLDLREARRYVDGYAAAGSAADRQTIAERIHEHAAGNTSASPGLSP